MKKYLMLFYSACGSSSRYISREEQVTNSYWLVSLMGGVNLASLFFLFNAIMPVEGLSFVFFLIVFTAPFIVNYFIFLRVGKKQIIITVDALIKNGELAPKRYIIKYVIMTIVFLAFSGAANNKCFQTVFN